MKYLRLFEEWGAAQADEYERHFGEQEPAGGKVDVKAIVAHPKMKAILADLEKKSGKKVDMSAAAKAAEMVTESKKWTKINEEFGLLLGVVGGLAALWGGIAGITAIGDKIQLKKELTRAIDQWCHQNRKEEITSTDDAVAMVDEIYNELKEGEWASGTPEQQELQKKFDNIIAFNKKGGGPFHGHTTFGGGTYGA